MGQYYKPVFLSEDKTKTLGFVCSHDFGSGLKLMEHSWMANPFVSFVERQLVLEPRAIVWAGDYADSEDGTDDGENLYTIAGETAAKLTHDVDFKEGENKYDAKYDMVPTRFKYLVNLDKNEFVDKSKTPDNDGWRIHPLPLLTCEGNGRGGGDFRGESELIGIWSRDKIAIYSKKSDIPKDCKEIIFNLSE